MLEAKRAGPYLIANLSSGGKTAWVATRGGETVKVGDEIKVTQAMLQQNFTSKSLNRTFEKIWFGNLAAKKGATGAASPTPPPAQPKKAVKHVQPAAPTGPGKKVTVAEFFALDPATAKGQAFTMTGKATRFSSGVLGRNWLHLQDGTGSADKKNNDITVTTATDATRVAIGDTVTVTGWLATNKDFGHGYSYALMMEGATVSKVTSPK